VETVERFADWQAAYDCMNDLKAKCPNENYQLHDDNTLANHEKSIAWHQRVAASHKEQFETLSANI
jgi:hypothetical protein